MEQFLAGQAIIITGGGQGIGRRLAQHLASLGAAVCIADIDPGAAQATLDLLQSANYAGMAVACDVTSVEDTEKMAAEVLSRFGSIDVLINNAGIFPIKMFGDISAGEWQRVIEINLTGTFLAAKAVYSQMKKQGQGKIINIASVAGRVGGAGFAHYSAAKAGVIGFTKALAREAGPLGIQVNAIAPGIIETDTAKAVFPGFALKEYTRNVPLGRLGREEDLPGIVSFLCSKESGYITGQVLAVDGGYTMV